MCLNLFNFIHHLLQICIFGEIISVIPLHVKRGCDPLLFYRKVDLNRSSLRDNHKGFPVVVLNNSSILWDLFKVPLRKEIFPAKSSRRPYFGGGLRFGDLKGDSFSVLACLGIFPTSVNNLPKLFKYLKGHKQFKRSHKPSHPRSPKLGRYPIADFSDEVI